MAKKSIINNQKVLVILGPTASGKTSLGVRLAVEIGGEIVSADSRQVYRGMDIGTGKDLPAYRVGRKNIPYHLIDVVNPQTKFNLARYQKLAFQALDNILVRGRQPIIVGGTGLYLQAVVDNYHLSAAKADSRLRQELNALSAEELLNRLEKSKPDFAARLNNSDRHNARRLSRYLEIILQGGEVNKARQVSPYDFLILGLDFPDDILRARIEQRILDRLGKEGLVAEVHRLHEEGVSWPRLMSFGLEYKFIAQHLQGHFDYQAMYEKLALASYRFAKRQKTWFKRWEKQGRKIIWLKETAEADKLVKNWLAKQ